jgi:hypothetical protein
MTAEDRYRLLACDMNDVITRHRRNGIKLVTRAPENLPQIIADKSRVAGETATVAVKRSA